MILNPSFSSRSDFICEADLFRGKTDLVEKTVDFVSKSTAFSGAVEQT